MKLIESNGTSLSTGTSPRHLAGEFATFDVENQNRRVYPRAIYEDAVKRLMDKVKSRQCLGECDHPLDYDEVRLSNVSHVITELRVEGNKVYGEVELLNTPAGKIVQALHEAGVPIGISSRAVGDVRVDRNGTEIVESCDLITYDLVADPSFKTAILSDSARTKLGESLRLVESRLPSGENTRISPLMTMMKGIRESLLTDSRAGVSDREDPNISEMTIKALESVAERQRADIRKLKESREVLSTETKRLAKTLRETKVKLKDSSTRLSSLTTRMHTLQEAYNSLRETTVSRDDYKRLQAELVETRKKLVVESRGMVYSQVRHLLEGTTTEEEISARLDSFRPARQSTVLKDLSRSKTLTESRDGKSGGSTGRLATIISQV